MTLATQHPSVLHLLTSLNFGGVEKRMEILAEQPLGDMQHLFCAIGGGGAAERRLKALGIPVQCLQQPTRIPSPAAILALFRLFRRLRPTVVHSHGAEANFHGLIAARLAGVPVRIGEEIGIPSHSPRARRIFRQVYRTAHCVIGMSCAVTDWLIESGEVPPAKAVRVYNPVKLPVERSGQAATPGALRVGFVGRLEAVKNPLALVEAADLLLARGIPVELWLIGEGRERARLEAAIRAQELDECVHLLGYQATPDEHIRQCHVYVQPSLSEGFSIALVEAMGCGVPVIATAVGGAPEIVDPGKTGWLLPEATPSALASVLEEAWRLGPQQLQAMGRRARAAVEGRFEPAEYKSRLEALYRQFAPRKAKGEHGQDTDSALS
ncbi:glycosyltransferase [Azotobacter chroococcum]|uniref:glycosyltransferase n=1 Tax=Azotobacter chroococcum TaxID=353 RepID=UPI0010393185|nr:glycosyltransferase [Azotobacter chroococcum]TBW08952.1 glycosyltransferase [Azotobacter chroococcum]